MARSTTPAGIGYKDKYDRNDEVFTSADSEFVAVTVDSAIRGVHTELEAVQRLGEAVLAMSGIGPTSPADAQTAALIEQGTTQTRKAVNAVVAGVKVSPFGVRVDAYGVVGDGVTDDTAAFHAAASAAATFGVPLVIPAGFSIGISSYKRLPEGLMMHAGGASFQQVTKMGRAPVVGLGPRSTVVGGLRVQTLGGDECQGVHIADAPDVTVHGGIEVRSASPGAGKGNIRDNGVRVINSPRFTADRVYVEGYDWAVWVDESPGFQIGWAEVSTYSLAVRIKGGCSQGRIHGGRAYRAGPNSSYLPGYNGLLMENQSASDDLRISNFTVEDAGEHGVRLSGFSTQTNIWFDNCMARNSGGSGFKVLGGEAEENTFRNRGITFNNCTAIDSGSINQNCCGFLIQRADDVRLINPVVKKDKKTYSAVEGIRLSGVSHVTVVSPKILDTHKYAIHIDEACGSIRDVTFLDTHIQTPSGHGIYLQNPGVEFRDMRFKGGLVEVYDGDGAGFYAGRYTSPEDSGTWKGMNELEITFSDSTGASRQISTSSSATALGSFMADITMWRGADVSPSWPPFAGGSMVLDRRLGSRQAMKAGSWVGL
ncbi:right-handed parallel beta-helix repeat-containing protein [Micrococcus luteus]|uniref:right-handed parallel beta-helix repeat-containing protein n=1 Tax=Micrococcus luteus TaxID=1270 RepID=UPI003D357317